MNKQRYVVTLGAAASLAALLAGCSKSTEKATTATSTATSITTSTTAITEPIAYGDYKEVKAVPSTTVNGLALNSTPPLKKFLEAYADYGYEKGVLGEPKDHAKPTHFGDGQFLEFKGKGKDTSFHAITLKHGAPRAYAVWGAIGDNWHGAHAISAQEAKWGYPVGIEQEETSSAGKETIIQKFEKGTVTFSEGKITFEPNKK